MAIRSESPTMPVIFISGEPGNGQFSRSAKGFFFLEKPFHAKDIPYATQRMLLSKQQV